MAIMVLHDSSKKAVILTVGKDGLLRWKGLHIESHLVATERGPVQTLAVPREGRLRNVQG